MVFALYGIGALALVGLGWYAKGKLGKQAATDVAKVDEVATAVVAEVKKV